ncbi:sugar efflux transporter [Streptomyces sp. NBC_00094]|uniref:sugar efflux transporter n=1 Tax=Streptomyces sp. NBC_00094 TaxID=2903620 RepID=UPI0022507E5B|nr:sugar efflux transporter [Streptomyces sp. NBC_00094]MCX5394024.1 sugar efflux transporter [Streptomyces sp. NBC_00094]
MTTETDGVPGTPGTPHEPGVAPTAPPGRLRLLTDPAVNSLIGATGTVGLAGAFVVPTVSLFLSEAVAATPLMIGLFFAGRAIAEVGTDLCVGVLSDRLRDRRTILVLTALFNAGGALCYSLVRNYYALFLAGVVLFGLGGACFGQLFAYTREFAESRRIDVSFFNGFLRSVTSLAWVVGPPIAFWLVARWDFTVLYACTTGLSLLAAVLCRWGLPDVAQKREGAEPTGFRDMFRGIGRRPLLLLVSIVLLLAANMMYQIALTLYLTEELGLGPGFAGVLLGLSAALEIPIMVYVGSRAERIGKLRLVVAAALCATLFFAVLPFASDKPALLLLQVPNAVWTAVVMSVPVVILQDTLPGRLGVASSLYASAFKTGMFLGGLAVGLVATWTGYAQVFWVCAGLTALAALLLLLPHPAQAPEAVEPSEGKPA